MKNIRATKGTSRSDIFRIADFSMVVAGVVTLSPHVEQGQCVVFLVLRRVAGCTPDRRNKDPSARQLNWYDEHNITPKSNTS
jgi:hypothetical protein